MDCYDSTITFLWDGKPHILPHPYYSSKSNQKGYNIIRTYWFQALFYEIELHVLHYLHNIVEDRQLKK